MGKLSKRIITIIMSAMLVFGTTTVAFAENTDNEVATIQDEEVPKAAAEDTCGVHWLVLILTVGVGGYFAIRLASEQRSLESESKHQEA